MLIYCAHIGAHRHMRSCCYHTEVPLLHIAEHCARGACNSLCVLASLAPPNEVLLLLSLSLWFVLLLSLLLLLLLVVVVVCLVLLLVLLIVSLLVLFI